MGIQYVLRQKTTVESVPTGIQCNVCGKVQTVAEHGVHEYAQDMHVIELEGGWGDRFPGDMCRLTFVACGDCLKEWTETFAVPVEEVWLMGGSVPFEATHSETGEVWVVDGLWAYPKGTEFKEPDDYEMPEGVDYPTDGVWEHFKGRRYKVIKSVLSNPASPEVMVVYQGLYDDSPTFVRPARMWSEEVEHPEREGFLLPRFRRIE